MAGDWIKMRRDLRTDPRVVRISSALKADTLRTVGALFVVWGLADAHTKDGFLEGYTLEILDEVVGLPGLAQAMSDVGWLELRTDGVTIPDFERHNSESAKKRAQDAVRKFSARQADKKRTTSGPEKRREEKSIKTPLPPKGGDAAVVEKIYQAYPRRVAKGAAIKAIRLATRNGVSAAHLLARVQRYAEIVGPLKGGEGERYIPHPATWFNQQRWEDGDDVWTSFAKDHGAVSAVKTQKQKEYEHKVAFLAGCPKDKIDAAMDALGADVRSMHESIGMTGAVVHDLYAYLARRATE